MKKLTIAIPTYNRKEAIASKINEISSYIINHSLSEQIELLIVDNCSSEYNIYEILENEKDTSFINVQKNSGNIGAGSNFLRCLELANSEYIWLLGDDEILDLSYLENLMTILQDKDCYLLPHNESYAKKATYFGNFSSIDELFDNFWNLGSFFTLSIFIFRKDSVLNYLKEGYETVVYQHPYSAMALSMLRDGKNIQLINLALLKVQTNAYSNLRFDIVNAYIDVVSTVKPFCTNKQFQKYLKNDFYPAREKTVFRINIGITKKVNLEKTIENYKRLISLVPTFSKIYFKSLIWINLVQVRKFNYLISLIIYTLSKIKKNNFSKKSLNDIYIYLPIFQTKKFSDIKVSIC